MPITLTRSLLVIILPGFVAAAPWLLLVALWFDNSYNYYYYLRYPLLANGLFFAVVVIVGSLFEGLNSIKEVKWDKEREKQFDVQRQWYNYLALICATEPVGFHYLTRLVTTMYFELSMMRAIPVFGLGSIAFHLFAYKVDLSDEPQVLAFYVPVLALSYAAYRYLKWQAKATHSVLCKTRLELNKRLKHDA